MGLLLDGIAIGLQFSLLAVGLTLIYGLGGVLNMAHGQFAVIAAIVTALIIRTGVNVPVAALLGILAAGFFALAIDRSLLLIAYRYKGETRLLLGLLLTLGLSIAILGFLSFRFPLTMLSIHPPVPSINLFGLTVRFTNVITVALSLLGIISLLIFLKKSSLGKAVRAIVQNESGAQLCGIDPGKIRTLIFILGGLMAGLAGITRGIFAAVGPAMGFELTILALIVAVVGGVRSINGTLVAGLLLGIVNAYTSYYIGAYMAYIILMMTAVATILVRPEGILGNWT